MINLSYGYEKPQNTDTGDVYFPAMERNIQRTNDHTHNGSDSAPVAMSTVTLAAANWTVVAGVGGLYSQDITFTGPLSYDSFLINFRLSTGQFVFPTVERLSASSMRVYTNDNSLTYIAYLK